MSKRVLTYGRKRNAIAVAQVTEGTGQMRCNGVPLELIQPQELRVKIFEPLLVLGSEPFSKVDMKIKVSGGGQVSQIYAIRQAIARGIVSWHQKCVDEVSRLAIKNHLQSFDRFLLISDPRRCEPKKFGGRGARARRQKSYR